MSKNYFAVERNGQCYDPVTIVCEGEEQFKEFLDMSYQEMKDADNLDEFVAAAMEATNNISGTDDDQTMVTLVGEDGVFIWGIMMGPGEDNDIRYVLVDWMKDGKQYKYVDTP